jgi:tetratricopeptide (TPR) repeat protein
MRLGLITALLATAFATAAIAQQMNPLAADAARSQQEFLNGLNYPGVEAVPTSDWSRCSARDRLHSAQAIRSCGRVIGERTSRVMSAAAYYYRAQLYHGVGDSADAQADLERALDLFDQIVVSERGSSTAHSNRASVLIYLRRYDEAFTDYESAIAIATQRLGGVREPGAPGADGLAEQYHARSALYFRTGDFERAVTDLDEALRLMPDASYYHAERCLALTAAHRTADAAPACEEALRLSDDGAYALFSRGCLRFTEGDAQAAFEDFSAAIAIKPNRESAYLLYGRGVAAQRLGRTAEGQADIDRARTLEPDDVEYYANAGLRP